MTEKHELTAEVVNESTQDIEGNYVCVVGGAIYKIYGNNLKEAWAHVEEIVCVVALRDSPNLYFFQVPLFKKGGKKFWIRSYKVVAK